MAENGEIGPHIVNRSRPSTLTDQPGAVSLELRSVMPTSSNTKVDGEWQPELFDDDLCLEREVPQCRVLRDGSVVEALLAPVTRISRIVQSSRPSTRNGH